MNKLEYLQLLWLFGFTPHEAQKMMLRNIHTSIRIEPVQDLFLRWEHASMCVKIPKCVEAK
jgi:hypothetical protein